MSTSVTPAYVAFSITHLVSVKVIEGLISMLRKRTVVTIMWIEAVIHVTVEAMWAMEPRAGADKNTAAEPLRTIVPVGGAAVWRIVKVSIRANRRYSDIDGDPGRCKAWARQDSDGQDNEYRQFPMAHQFLLILS
jgi:hypothetical protein